MRRKHLPVENMPGFETECYHNVRLSILMTNPNFHPWYMSHFINLLVQIHHNDQFPMVRFEEHVDIYYNLFIESPLKLEDNMELAIKRRINEGEYVLAFIDWSNIQSSRYYREEARIHEGLIYGYDEEKKTFDWLAFEVDGKAYGKVEISYEQSILEIQRIFETQLRKQQWFTYYGFPLTSIKWREKAPLSLDLHHVFFAFERGQMLSSADSNSQTYSLGFQMNEVMSKYFVELSRGRKLDVREHTLWNIHVYKMLLHKKLMLQRLQYLHQTSPSPLLERAIAFYVKAEHELKGIRTLSLRYQRTGHKEHLSEIGQKFKKIYVQEKRAVPMIMEYLVLRQLQA